MALFISENSTNFKKEIIIDSF